MWTDGQSDMAKLIGVFLKLSAANSSKNNVHILRATPFLLQTFSSSTQCTVLRHIKNCISYRVSAVSVMQSGFIYYQEVNAIM
jgi:hypothetical protein